MTITENTAITAAEDPCPSWCTAEHNRPGDDAHAGYRTEIALSLAEPVEAAYGILPDYLAVQVWLIPAFSAAPTVGIQHADQEVADMTPAEAVALAAALVREAWRIDPGAVEAIAAQDDPRYAAGSCPPWCNGDGHDSLGDVHYGDGVSVPADEHACPSPEFCNEDICAHLALNDDGYPVVELHHDGDSLPNIRVTAAEALAWKILGLGCVARVPAPGAQG